jgi:RNA polymerase sigma-70 factor (ECF subfamily)
MGPSRDYSQGKFAEDIDDQAVIALVLSGHVERFGDLVKKYQDRVYRFIVKVNSGLGMAEDLTQETFLEAFKNLKAFGGRSRFPTWVLGIALNICRNHYHRAPEKRFHFLSAEYIGEKVDSQDNPTQYLEKKQHMARLKNAIDKLPDPLREVLFLRVFEGLSYAEVGDLVGIPEGTVKSRLHSARKMLNAALEKDG